MKLEGLANELLLDLFEFLDPVQLIRAFEGLNTRFERLLFVHFRSYRLDFRSIAKFDFHLMCEQYLPLIIDQVRSICLSDGEETPRLPDYLLSYGITIDEFTHLRSLVLQKMDSSETILNTISDCFYLPHLTHLKIIECHFKHEKNPHMLIADIWRLVKLTHCTLDLTFEGRLSFAGLPVISTSIENLFIKNFTFSFMELSQLFKSTPQLRHLGVTFEQGIDAQFDPIAAVPSIITLKLHFDGSLPAMINIFRSMPNLLHLTLETRTINLNGNEWKEILINHLPKIKVFRLLMKVFSSQHNHTEKQLDDLLTTFRTPFWLDEHRWFVRCDLPQHTNKAFFLYTLPYCFDDTYGLYQNKWSKSTCLNTRDYSSYDRVSNVFYKRRFDDLALFPFRYPNIHRLTVRLPFDDNFWSIIPALDHLTSLEVIELRENNQSKSQLQILLNRAPRLNVLSIDATSVLLLAQLNITHSAFRRLHLKHYRAKTNRYMNAAQCSMLANSSLGRQCEVLLIHVENRAIVLDLVRTMNNLRALTCECQDDKWIGNRLLSKEDEFIEWLQNSLPDNYSIHRQQQGQHLVRLWINK